MVEGKFYSNDTLEFLEMMIENIISPLPTMPPANLLSPRNATIALRLLKQRGTAMAIEEDSKITNAPLLKNVPLLVPA